MKLENLSKEEREALKKEIEQQARAEEKRIFQERENYKGLVEEFVTSNLEKLKELSDQMMRVKEEVFSEASALIELKNELYNTKSDRRSDTFSSSNGSSITLGNRTSERWDDTANEGIEKVKEYMSSLAKDENSAVLVETVMGLLAKDQNGALKANKVLELEKLAQRSENPTFKEGIQIIREAYRPLPSCRYIEVSLRDKGGSNVKLPLTLSSMK